MQSKRKFKPKIVNECKTSAADPDIIDRFDLKIEMDEFTSSPQTFPNAMSEFKIKSIPEFIQYH